MILSIDPGPLKSAVLLYDGKRPVYAVPDMDNDDLLERFRCGFASEEHYLPDVAVIESVESYGMAVGKEVFETCYWIGRFREAIESYRIPMRPGYELCAVHLMPRRAVKLHLCGSARAKDTNIRAAIADRFGGFAAARGKKSAPGPLYGIRTHCWSALALAITFWETNAK